MRSINRIACAALLVISISIVGNAQDGKYYEVRDFESWTSAKLNIKTNSNWNFGVQGQFRLDNNSTEFKGFFTEFTMGYKLFKGMAITGGLRFTGKVDNDGSVQGTDYYFRYNLDASYKHKIERFSLLYRFRYQNRNEFGVSKIEGDIPVQYFRLKASVKYNIKNWKFDPVLSGELFNKYENGGYDNGWSDYRLTFGTNYKTKNFGKIGVFYRVEKEITSFYPKTTHVLRIKYTYTIKK